uniref:Uncharacterized protein n=1 Tax=Rhipicephalus zambeziensis TaxID=60191 RepID=A0A224YJW4_9ACAR
MATVSWFRMFVAVATLAFILSTLLEGTLCEDEEAFRIRFPKIKFKIPKIKMPKVPSVELVKPSLSPLKKIPKPSFTGAVTAGSEIASSAAQIHMVTQSQQAPQYQDYQQPA